MTVNAQTDRIVLHGGLASQLFTAAWMSVALGFVLELLSVLGAFSLGGRTSTDTFLVNVGQKVSWGTLVCVGLACAKAFKPRDAGASAWAGMLGAPVAFTAARSVHKGLAQAVGLSVASAAPGVLVLLATIKALEYGVLGAALARHDQQENASVGSYLRTGAWVGVLFGGTVLAVMGLLAPAPLSVADWVARGINEILFPIGCSLILFAAGVAGKRLG